LRLYLRIIVVIVGAVALICGQITVSAAHADSGYVASGKVQCVNSEGPVGIWVEAQNGGSGWADMGVDVSDGWGWTHYSKAIPNGGSFYLNVGCGGSSEAWGLSAWSDTAVGALNVVCNDIPWWLQALKGRFPYLGWADFTQGVPYGRCGTV
jgi:hypothetical protein